MGRLPVVSGREARKVFEKVGWSFARQQGSHMIFVKPGMRANLSIPDHNQLDRGTLAALIRTSGMTADAFMEIMRSL